MYEAEKYCSTLLVPMIRSLAVKAYRGRKTEPKRTLCVIECPFFDVAESLAFTYRIVIVPNHC